MVYRPNPEFICAIEDATGRRADYLQRTPLDVQRRDIEKRHGAKMRVLGECLLTHEEIERELDYILNHW